MQNSLLKFNDLRDFYARMVIVAPKNRYMEFQKRLSYSAFSELNINKRVKFLSYEELVRQYEREIELQAFEVRL